MTAAVPVVGAMPTLDLAAFRAFARANPGGKWEVCYRIPTTAPTGEFADYPDRPGPAFYVLAASYPTRQVLTAMADALGLPGEPGTRQVRSYVYLDPAVGALLRGAGYIHGGARPRGLERILGDLENAVAAATGSGSRDEATIVKDMGEREAARLADEARHAARHAIAYQVRKLNDAIAARWATAEVPAGLQPPGLWLATMAKLDGQEETS